MTRHCRVLRSLTRSKNGRVSFSFRHSAPETSTATVCGLINDISERVLVILTQKLSGCHMERHRRLKLRSGSALITLMIMIMSGSNWRLAMASKTHVHTGSD